MDHFDFNIEDIIDLCSQSYKKCSVDLCSQKSSINYDDDQMIIDDECLDQIINQFPISVNKKITPINKIVITKPDDPIQLLYEMIQFKKENNFYQKRIKFLNNILRNKRNENCLSNFIQNEFINEIKIKQDLIKNYLDLPDEDSKDIVYALNKNPTKSNLNNFKTEKKVAKKKQNLKSNRSANN